MKIPTIKHPSKLTFYLLLALVLVIRLATLIEFGFQFTGSDDLTFWQGAIDYSQGVFHEPFFYAQNYNFMLESFVAAPLLWLGIPVYIALPIVSTFMGVFPFVVISWALFQRKLVFPAFVFLLLPITLPIEYDVMTSITRGFTSGLFFSGFLIFPLLNSKTSKYFWVLGLTVAVGYLFNPNSLILAFPVCLFLWIENIKNPRFYVYFILPIIPILLLKMWAESFYDGNSDYLVHRMWKLDFSFSMLMEAFGNLDKYFKYIMPVFWKGGWMVVFAILAMGLKIWKHNWKKGLSLVLGVIFILALMGVNKVNDGKDVIFFSSTRMFLGVPFILGLAILWWYQEFKKSQEWITLTLTLAISVFFIKISIYPMVVKAHTTETNYGQVAIKQLDVLTTECDQIEKMVRENNVDFVVFVPWGKRNVPEIEFYNYGCPSVTEVSFSSVMNIYERRTWVYLKEKTNTRKSFLLFNPNISKLDSITQVMDCRLIQQDPNVVLLKNNSKSLEEIAEIFEIPFKRNAYY